ncbi:pyruvate ferredoxin oxidoreductase [Candidatus Bathyarchaeota archaeon]|jgi:pyruvate ferredoxin oxidoreductase beta subunit|nr:pyruvate ferredoxin oxidoreductase [Candidatus Bathyarchaeota archaeon]MBT4319998.1 pyruvate ferredoxin oxidoreductase [Candidatus Bathyarchaeota archaeon]MBT5641740.1 pyruvate ferredoxin oxidoreductase [Candidatus Bathyarchaeota archaeon]MBT6604173.1 pyruvate ferredoxin oxidoreductase [Candidatus Bathyarchaeota archaeon]
MERLTLKDAAYIKDTLMSGHRLCAGCAHPIVGRMIMKASADIPTIVTNATGCLEVATTIFPFTSWNVPWLHNAFENAAANASGIEATWRAQRRSGKGPLAKYENLNVIAFGGDGGTYDIGFQAISGAFERGHHFTYVLMDNEAYMNTGIQRSGGTPLAASTTTSPAGSVIKGKTQWKKPIDEIMIAHEIPYVATMSPAYPQDVLDKCRKAFSIEGPKFLHAFIPCTRGWRYPTEDSVTLARLATQTCIFPLYEVTRENGRPVYKLSGASAAIARRPQSKKPVEEYLKGQGRFRHLFRPEENKELLEAIQEGVDHRWQLLLEKCNL